MLWICGQGALSSTLLSKSVILSVGSLWIRVGVMHERRLLLHVCRNHGLFINTLSTLIHGLSTTICG